MEGLRGQQFAGARLALEGSDAEMGSGAAHAREEVLHGEVAAGHGLEHPGIGAEQFRER